MTLVISAVPSQAFKMLAEFLKLGSVSDLLTNEKLVKAGTKAFYCGRCWCSMQIRNSHQDEGYREEKIIKKCITAPLQHFPDVCTVVCSTRKMLEMSKRGSGDECLCVIDPPKTSGISDLFCPDQRLFMLTLIDPLDGKVAIVSDDGKCKAYVLETDIEFSGNVVHVVSDLVVPGEWKEKWAEKKEEYEKDAEEAMDDGDDE
eukprot:scaffold72912_cov26-Tisochrysis_lutea.AAC.1